MSQELLLMSDLYFCSGIAVGHVYFFLEDVFPNQPGGGRWLRTPSFLCVHKHGFFVVLMVTIKPFLFISIQFSAQVKQSNVEYPGTSIIWIRFPLQPLSSPAHSL